VEFVSFTGVSNYQRTNATTGPHGLSHHKGCRDVTRARRVIIALLTDWQWHVRPGTHHFIDSLDGEGVIKIRDWAAEIRVIRRTFCEADFDMYDGCLIDLCKDFRNVDKMITYSDEDLYCGSSGKAKRSN
jgi:hypothetical protein